MPAWPGSEPALLWHRPGADRATGSTAIVRRCLNWAATCGRSGRLPSLRELRHELRLYAGYTAVRRAETGIPARSWRSDGRPRRGPVAARTTSRASAGVLGGWLTARCLFFLNLWPQVDSRRHRRAPGTNGCPGRPTCPPPEQWNELTWPRSIAGVFECRSCCRTSCSGAARRLLAASTTRSGPTGRMTWVGLTREDLRSAALTGLERDGLVRRLRHPSAWASATTCTATRPTPAAGSASASRATSPPSGTRSATPETNRARSGRRTSSGSSCLADRPDGCWASGASGARPAEKMTVDDYYGWIFEHSVPESSAAAREGLTPLATSQVRRVRGGRRYGATTRRMAAGVVVDAAARLRNPGPAQRRRPAHGAPARPPGWASSTAGRGASRPRDAWSSLPTCATGAGRSSPPPTGQPGPASG